MMFVKYRFDNLKEKTLNLLSTSTWKYISLYALMDEKFIFKWSHKIDLFRLKMNEKGCVYGGATFYTSKKSF